MHAHMEAQTKSRDWEKSAAREEWKGDTDRGYQPTQILDGYEAPFSLAGKKIVPERVRGIQACPKGERGWELKLI